MHRSRYGLCVNTLEHLTRVEGLLFSYLLLVTCYLLPVSCFCFFLLLSAFSFPLLFYRALFHRALFYRALLYRALFYRALFSELCSTDFFSVLYCFATRFSLTASLLLPFRLSLTSYISLSEPYHGAAFVNSQHSLPAPNRYMLTDYCLCVQYNLHSPKRTETWPRQV